MNSACAHRPPNPPPWSPTEMTLTEDLGATPVTVDPAVAYDTASGEMIFNVYDTLITFNAENVDQYIGSIASNWWSQNITGTTSPAGLPWYWRYTFQITPGINFAAPPGLGLPNYPLTTTDIQYSFWRTMILDASGPNGPAWMLYEPLLGNAAGPNALGNMAIEASVSRVGTYIQESVGANATHVWFNIAYPGAYSPFLKILCQTWSSILSMQYINNYTIGTLGTVDWSGNWSARSTKFLSWTMSNTGWIDQFGVYMGGTGPLDVGGEYMYGSGPFMLTNYNVTGSFWTMTRNSAYFRGWPASFPVYGVVRPAGYVNNIQCNFNQSWAVRKAALLSGACDFANVPRNSIGQVYQNPTPPYNPPLNYPQNGVRCYPNLAILQAGAMFFTFNINASTPYGQIFPPGVYGPTGIPSDFFSNPVTGIHVRKAFAYAMNYSAYIQQGLYGEANHVYTALIPGLQYYNPSVIGYNFNPTAAAAELAQVPGILASGFNVSFLYTPSDLAAQTAATILQAEMATINSTFVVTPLLVNYTAWSTAIKSQMAPIFRAVWLADFPDMHDFALAFYLGTGPTATFAAWQGYNNATINSNIAAGIAAQNGPARQQAYTALAQDVIADCPSVMLDQPLGRHFERDVVNGWYYNPSYPGIYYYNLWKFWYLPQCAQNAPNPPTQPLSDMLPADVDSNGVVSMRDIGAVAYCFGAIRGPPVAPTWNFRCDVDVNGVINMKDIGFVAKNFNPASWDLPTWP